MPIPLVSNAGSPVGTAAGIFSLSGKSRTEMRTRMLRATLLVVAIVVMTAALLYPVIVALTSRVTRFSVAVLNANLETLQLLGGAIAKRDREAIPIGARVFAIADVFDALTSRRPYKEPFSFEWAMESLEQGRASHFDADLLDAFAGIARPSYDRLANRDDDPPATELHEIIQLYFSGGLDQLA